MKKKNKIILLTHHFPYGKGEPFIEAEMEYAFGDISILTLANEIDYSDKYSNLDIKVKKFLYHADILKICITAIILIFKRVFWEKLRYLKESNMLYNIKIFYYLRHIYTFTIRSEELQKYIYHYIKKYKSRKIILYSYWLSIMAYSIFEVKKKYSMKNIITVSRAHRIDLYSNTIEYLPYYEYSISNIDYLCFISEHGKKYLSNKYNINDNKLKLFYLGTEKTKFIDIKNNNELKIISCSHIIRFKRIDLLIDTLSLLDVNIQWIHIGYGTDKEYENYIKKYAEEQLLNKKNIEYKFLGYMPNKEVLKYYKEHYFDLFINTSSSEGLPVSIMEAMSFGIPAIGGNINGIPEIIEHKKNGFLFDKNAKAEDIAKLIEKYYHLSYEEKKQLRINAYNTWDNKFNAEKNYKEFYKFLNEL